MPAAVLRRFAPLERFPIRLAGAAAGLLLVAVPGSLVVISVGSHWGPVLSLDTAISAAVHRAALGHPALRGAAAAVTHLGDTLTRTGITVAAVAVLAWRRAYRSALFLATVVPLGGLIDTGSKVAVGRTRPVLAEPFAHANGASFPSGHAMGSMVVYGSLLLVALPFLPPRSRLPARWLTAGVVLAVGASRVVLGVHYPTDVLGGWLIGWAWLLLAILLFNRWRVECGERAVADPGAAGIEPEAGVERSGPGGVRG